MSAQPRPKASIIVLAYRHEDCIRQALESVLAQKCAFPYEIIIGEDGSPDRTRAICEEYARRHAERVRLMPAAPNKGIVRNYFDCLRAARGEYIGDCAGDDSWGEPDRLQRQVDYLDSHPEASAVISDWTISEGGQLSHTAEMPEYQAIKRGLDGPEWLDYILRNTERLPLLSAMLYRREPVAELLERRPETVCRDEWGCEDFPLEAALSAIGRLGYTPGEAYNYTLAPGSISQAADAGHRLAFYIKSLRCHIDLCGIYGKASRDYADTIYRKVLYMCSLALEAGDADLTAELRGQIAAVSWVKDWKIRLYLAAISKSPLRRLIRRAKGL